MWSVDFVTDQLADSNLGGAGHSFEKRYLRTVLETICPVTRISDRVELAHRTRKILNPLQLSFVQLSGPAQNDRHGCGFCLLHLCDDQKSLAVAADIVNELVIRGDWLSGSGLE